MNIGVSKKKVNRPGIFSANLDKKYYIKNGKTTYSPPLVDKNHEVKVNVSTASFVLLSHKYLGVIDNSTPVSGRTYPDVFIITKDIFPVGS